MQRQNNSRISGFYTANLLGNIRSHLAGLQGYDVMALELIQNADDAKAESVFFDITEKGLYVYNTGNFTYCGDLQEQRCPFFASNGYSCDYHRIVDVGSGGKLARGENIGRFGIGFVSTYQVTDHPEIRSSGISLTLRPEDGQWFIDESSEQCVGTTFFLSWADDPNTETRRSLGVSHVSSAHIDQLVKDFISVLQHSLLFLRHVRTAEVRRNGTLLFACDLVRGDGDLIVGFRPSGISERWLILRTEASESALNLYRQHPTLETLARSTNISIGLRIEPEPLTKGLLYAFLPTEQLSGLPLHINADFFPESDRKAIIFAGHQHEQAWNEMLIDSAAAELARDPEGLLKLLGDDHHWQILQDAYELSKATNHPICFHLFWERLKATASSARIVLAHDGSMYTPSGVFFSDKVFNRDQMNVFKEIGGQFVAEVIRKFKTVILQLGTPILTLAPVVDLLERSLSQQVSGVSRVDATKLKDFYQPIWGIVNDLLPDTASQSPSTKSTITRLSKIPFLLTEDFYVVNISQSFVTPGCISTSKAAVLLPCLAIVAEDIKEFSKIVNLIERLDLGAVVTHIAGICTDGSIEECILHDKQHLRELYEMLALLDRQGYVDSAVYQILLDLPIWLSNHGLIKANQALLPGNYTDPTGQSDLLDTSVLTDAAKEFMSAKLGVLTQSIEAFVQCILPKFFNEDGPKDENKYPLLMSELANHPSLINEEEICKLLGSLPIVPTQNGRWSCPKNTYRRTEALVKVLGDAKHLWLDSSRIPRARSVHSFVDSLGLRQSASAQHLMDRMINIAENSIPNEDAKRSSGEAFYLLCEKYDEWSEKGSFRYSISKFGEAKCFPAEGEAECWYSAKDLYAPYRADAFRSQAKILDFKNTLRLETKLLEDLGVTINPETTLVIDHLQHCVNMCVQPHVSTYQILNERARTDELISTLKGTRCIYIESQKIFVRPNHLYWTPQQLGRYAFAIPGKLESFMPLFNALGVKNSPDVHDLVEILLDIVEEYFEKSKPLTGPDRSVYEFCLEGVSKSDELEEIDAADIRRLQEAPSMLNLLFQPTYPDEVLLQDSEWHAGFFDGELDRALCKPAPEFWHFVEKLGVGRLSECAKVAIDFLDGSESVESDFAEKLVERAEILARLLHDKPTVLKQKVLAAFTELSAVSYEVVHIRASVVVGGDKVSAPPMPAYAFFDAENSQLILARPAGNHSWPYILSAIFHQLMPEESGCEISKLTLSVRPLMSMTVNEAHRELTVAGIPYLEAIYESGPQHDLTSCFIDDMGCTAEHCHRPENLPIISAVDTSAADENSREPMTTCLTTDGSHSHPDDEMSFNQLQRETHFSNNFEGEIGSNSHSLGRVETMRASTSEKRTNKTRPKYKEQRNRRLLSYVMNNPDEIRDINVKNDSTEHNLAVEKLARAAVCEYEKVRGRVAEQMAQTHPGYDIISRDPLTEEERYIEVKGISGEWNQTGVGLSRLQFSNSQDYGKRYWLYVVEFVYDTQYTRVHPIQNPAGQVTSFMFDSNWREAVNDERADPSLAFIPGARIKHRHFGYGMIESVELRGATRFMSINFETYGPQRLPLNLQTMDLVEVEDVNNLS